MERGLKKCPAAAVAVLVVLAFLAGAEAQEVGKFIQVENKVDHLKKGQEPATPAKVQGGVDNLDMVRTAEASRARVRFVDDTTMMVAPKSKVTIEEYMYDAKKGKRQAVIQVIEGVMETVVPRTLPKEQTDFLIRTTTAIAGIRGTRISASRRPPGQCTSMLAMSSPISCTPAACRRCREWWTV